MSNRAVGLILGGNHKLACYNCLACLGQKERNSGGSSAKTLPRDECLVFFFLGEYSVGVFICVNQSTIQLAQGGIEKMDGGGVEHSALIGY